jgi:hypothetical protein
MTDKEILAQFREMEQARTQLYNAGYSFEGARENKDNAQMRFDKAKNVLLESARDACQELY